MLDSSLVTLAFVRVYFVAGDGALARASSVVVGPLDVRGL